MGLSGGGPLRSLFIHQSCLLRNRILVPIAALAVVLAACGGAGEVATVDGEAVTFGEVADLIPSEGDTVELELFARSLMLVIADRVMEDEAERQFDLTRTEADVDAKVEELVLQSGQTEEEILTTYDLTTASLRVIAAQQLMVDRISALLAAQEPLPTEETLMERYEAMLPSVTQACSSHILLESREEADAALARALAGEDFGALAIELSVGPSGPSRGELGCSSPDQYVAEFAAAVRDAEVNVPYGPVQTQFGWHVILVSDRAFPSFEDVRESLVADIQAAAGGRLWTDWVAAALTAAEVTVEPEYGTWTTDPVPNVLPPAP